MARVVQVTSAHGGGNFAWIPGQRPTDGEIDPYAFFCVKAGHHSTTAWSESVSIGRRVYAPPPPPPAPAQQVTIALTPNQTVRGSIPVKISVTGFAAGTLKYFIPVDGAQKWFWNTATATVTQWWGTKAHLNGTHSLSVRVTAGSGKSATTTVNVLVR